MLQLYICDVKVESWRQHLPAAAPVIVKGLDRHLEKKQAAIRLKEQQRERENEVFNVQNIQHYRKPEDGSTVVEVRLHHNSVLCIT